jgi:hypothetical protein
MAEIKHSCQLRISTLGPPSVGLQKSGSKILAIACRDRRIHQPAGPAGHGGGMTALNWTLLGTDLPMATINDDPFTLTALIFDAQVQLPIHLAAAAEQITAYGTHT